MAEDNSMPALRSVDDGHESRIQNLEQDVSDLRDGVTENKVSLGYVSKAIEDGFKTTATQLEKGFGEVGVRMTLGETRLTSMAEVLEDHGRKFEKMDEDKVRAAERWSSLKKWAAAASAGGLAIALKELVQYIVHLATSVPPS